MLTFLLPIVSILIVLCFLPTVNGSVILNKPWIERKETLFGSSNEKGNRWTSSHRYWKDQLRKYHQKIPTVDVSIASIRGGATKKGDDNDEIDDDSGGNSNEINDDDDDDDDGTKAEQKNQVVSYVTDMWKKTPPISQVYVGSAIGLAVLSFILNKNQWPDIFNLDWIPVITKLQIWRPITAFLYFGPIGINYILTMQFVWTYMAQLEKLNYSKPEEFLTMLVFGAVSLIGSYSILGLSTKFLGHNLSTYLVYIWARLFEGSEVNVMDLFTLKAELLPWFFCAQTFLLEGEIPFADMLGIVVGHLYHYLSKSKILSAPKILKDWFSSPKIKEKYARFKDEFE